VPSSTGAVGGLGHWAEHVIRVDDGQDTGWRLSSAQGKNKRVRQNRTAYLQQKQQQQYFHNYQQQTIAWGKRMEGKM